MKFKFCVFMLLIIVLSGMNVMAAGKKEVVSKKPVVAENKEANSILRVTCGDDIGAEVLIDGKFKGECPVDITIAEGAYKLQVIKKIDESSEKFYERNLRVGDGTLNKIDAVLVTRLNERAQKLKDQRLAEELERLRQQGVEAGNGKPFSDCPECPEMVLIPNGGPVSQVLAIGKTEVTQGQWKAIMGNNPSFFKKCGDNCPVELVSWDDTQAFIRKLNAKTGKLYRLPRYVESNYACSAGEQYKYCGSDDYDSVAWHSRNSTSCKDPREGGGTYSKCSQPVAQKRPNAWGIYDLVGNVLEWLHECGLENCTGRGVYARSWDDNIDWLLRNDKSLRGMSFSSGKIEIIGFRLVRELP